MEKFDLAPAEWNIMECLWERAPQTGRELTEQLEASSWRPAWAGAAARR